MERNLEVEKRLWSIGFLVNKELCSSCKGKYCCQRQACDCSPLDFNNDISEMRMALLSGNYSIDFARKTPKSFVNRGYGLTLDLKSILDSRDEALYIHARNVNRPIVDLLHGPASEGPCVLWHSEKGCLLDDDHRPTYGKLTVPVNDGEEGCPALYCNLERDIMVNEWRQFQVQLFGLAKDFFDENWHMYRLFDFHL